MSVALKSVAGGVMYVPTFTASRKEKDDFYSML